MSEITLHDRFSEALSAHQAARGKGNISVTHTLCALICIIGEVVELSPEEHQDDLLDSVGQSIELIRDELNGEG
jgi:hypothetical protein